MALNLSRFNPFSDITHIDVQQNSRAAPTEIKSGQREQPEFSAAPRIKMDVTETEKAYTVKAEIPGARKENIKISINGNQVSISAETRNDIQEKRGESLVRGERYYGHQYRCFALASAVDDTKADARYQNGVLELILPKKTAATSKNLVIH